MKLKKRDGTVSDIKQCAIIGATASGKTALAIEMATKYNAVIFSIDSLAIFKEMDIVSAKPTQKEQAGIRHFGIDALEPTEHFSAAKVALLYQEALAFAKKQNQHLIIVGGSSFYLKSLLTGLSEIPTFSDKTVSKAKEMLADIEAVYTLFERVDPQSLLNIERNDAYRLEKLLLIYLETNEKPSVYYAEHPAQPIIESLEIFDLQNDRDYLRQRIALRTELMLKGGLVDEIAKLEYKYGRKPSSMKAIGVIETLRYLDNEIDLETLKDEITTHTSQLAKRQTTFNKTQFENTHQGDKSELLPLLDKFFS